MNKRFIVDGFVYPLLIVCHCKRRVLSGTLSRSSKLPTNTAMISLNKGSSGVIAPACTPRLVARPARAIPCRALATVAQPAPCRAGCHAPLQARHVQAKCADRCHFHSCIPLPITGALQLWPTRQHLQATSVRVPPPSSALQRRSPSCFPSGYVFRSVVRAPTSQICPGDPRRGHRRGQARRRDLV